MDKIFKLLNHTGFFLGCWDNLYFIYNPSFDYETSSIYSVPDFRSVGYQTLDALRVHLEVYSLEYTKNSNRYDLKQFELSCWMRIRNFFENYHE